MSVQKYVSVSLLGAFLIFVHLLFSVGVHAQDRTLKIVMAEMGRNFNLISRPIQQGTAGPAEAQLVRGIHALALEASAFTPDFVLTFPVEQQPTLMEHYKNSMQSLAQSLVELAVSIESPKEVLVKNALAKVIQIRSQGHAEFRPPVRP